MELLHELLHNTNFVWCAMAVIIFIITQIIKQPYKFLTKKTIKNERARKIANTVILLLPFAFGILLEFLYTTYYLHSTFTIIAGLTYGTTSLSLYNIVERFFKIKIDNPYNTTEEGKAVTELIEDITADGKIDNTDKSAVQEFLDKLTK